MGAILAKVKRVPKKLKNVKKIKKRSFWDQQGEAV